MENITIRSNRKFKCGLFHFPKGKSSHYGFITPHHLDKEHHTPVWFRAEVSGYVVNVNPHLVQVTTIQQGCEEDNLSLEEQTLVYSRICTNNQLDGTYIGFLAFLKRKRETLSSVLIERLHVDFPGVDFGHYAKIVGKNRAKKIKNYDWVTTYSSELVDAHVVHSNDWRNSIYTLVAYKGRHYISA